CASVSSPARCAFTASSRVIAASTFSGGKLSMARFRLIANPISVGRCEQRRCRARLDHALTQRQQKLVDLFVVQVRRDVLENELARQHAGGKTEIFAGLFFVERFQCLCTLAQLAARCRRLAPMAQNIFEDLSRKPLARALWPAPTVAQLKLTFGVTHRSSMHRIWTNRQLATHYCTRIASDLSC